MAIHDIKDKTPNQATIDMLAKMLDDAKSGELRTVVVLTGFDDDSWGHAWSIDERNRRRRMIGEMTLLHHDLVVNQSLADGDSVLATAFSD